MKWSFSESRSFKRCPRQWYFSSQVAFHNAKDPRGKEAYYLKNLDSVSAWRGNVVDKVIEKHVNQLFKSERRVTYSDIVAYARRLFNKQLNFAKRKRWRELGMTREKGSDEYLALYDLEYSNSLCEAEIEQAWNDIEVAFKNLYTMDALLLALRPATKLAPQRPLSLSRHTVSIQAKPDLIAFYEDRPPLIVDWKVHTFGVSDYRLQLAIYAITLTECNPHRDFPLSLEKYSPTDIRLLEVQLLTNQLREYTLTDEDIENVENYIAGTSARMQRSLGTEKNKTLSPFNFAVTENSDECLRCKFRKLCWEESLWQE